jgi:hypothetical protein
LPFPDFFFATGNSVGETVYNKSRYMLATNKAQTIPIGTFSHLLLPSNNSAIKDEALTQQPAKTNITNNPIRAKDI